VRKEIISEWIYEFGISDELLETTLSIVDDLAYENNSRHADQSEDRFLHLRPELSGLFEWFHSCLNEAGTDLGLRRSEFKIVMSWANKSSIGNGHHPHTHPNSWISGILYLTNSNSSTHFSKPTIWADMSTSDVLLPMNFSHNFYQNRTEKGKLILFPSSLLHCVNPHQLESDRKTLSFDAVPWGITGDPESLSWIDLSKLG
jgi:uncharacterized protein (TIGR02466 family)